MTADVDVQFHGGWLTQFYPQATPDAPGLKQNSFNFGPIDASTIGRLTWTNLQVGAAGQIPETEEAVWLTPRNVHASRVRTSNNESEKYLFYRGVGNIASPLSVASDQNRQELTLKANIGDVVPSGDLPSIHHLWLVDIRSEGSVAYRTLKPIKLLSNSPQEPTAVVKSSFTEAEHNPQNLAKLQQEIHAALMSEGLFDEEATAMLQTWQKSYFAAGGLRLFYVVPREWTDHFLPLNISREAEIKRVMVARTELISPEQRKLLAELATGPVSDPQWIDKLPGSPALGKFREGRSEFGDLGAPIPKDFQTYLNLGRFRNALVLYEQSRRPTPELNKFIASYGLEEFQPPAAKP